MLNTLTRLLVMLAMGCGVVVCGGAAQAQILPTPAPKETQASAGATPSPQPAPAPDPLGRETPRGTVSGLLSALGQRDYARAALYFERRTMGEQSARELQALLDNGGSLLPFGALSDDKAGAIDDGLNPSEERVGNLGDADNTPILLSHQSSRSGVRIWLVSTETTKAARKLQPQTAPEAELGPVVAGASVGDWVRLLGIAALVFLGFQAINGGILFAMGRIITDKESSRVYRLTQAAMPPLSLFFATVIFMVWAGSMPVSIVARQLLLRYVGVFAWIALAWFLFRMTDSISGLLISRMAAQERRQAVSVVTLMRRTAKILLLFIAVVAVLDTFGIDVTTGVAALGIGGIALALGAQKTVENLVGSVTLIADKPVQVGDFCKVGDVTGTIEDIGIRSTRIRTLDRTLVTIPNGDFSSRQIENYAHRDRYLFNPLIALEYGIGSARMLQAVEAIAGVLHDHDRVTKPGARALLKNFAPSAIEIEVFAYIEAVDFDESLIIRQDLLLLMLSRLEAMEIKIALPASKISMARERASKHPLPLLDTRTGSGGAAPDGGVINA